MNDLISRQKTIDAINALHEHPNAWLDCAVDAVIALPTEQTERKKGKWIVYYECPKCGEITKDFTEYCPFCNADMRGEEE